MSEEPRPPVDIRAVMADRREIPLECAYEGMDDGLHRWAAVWTLPELPEHVLIGHLPAHTSVLLHIAEAGASSREAT